MNPDTLPEPTFFPDGIYFGMPEETYHKLQRLSNSAICKLRISAADFWADSWLNPNPKVLTPEQQARQQLVRTLGRAYHAARLEPDTFHDRFVRQLDKADFEGVDGFLSNGKELGEALGALGQTKSKAGESVLEQAERLAAAGYQGPIWHLEERDWLADLNGRTPIPAINWDEIIVDMERLRAVPAVQELLTGGQAEVTILYTCPDTGLPMKARLDYLKSDSWTDFKTFSNPVGKNLNQVIVEAFKYNRYHLQAYGYRGAVEMIRTGGLEIQGKATDAQRQLVADIRDSADELRCHYVFQQKGGVPNVLERRVEFWQVPLSTVAATGSTDADAPDRLTRLTRHHTAYMEKAKREIRAAKRDFVTYSKVYKPGEPWLPFHPSGVFSDEDFGNYWIDEEIN